MGIKPDKSAKLLCQTFFLHFWTNLAVGCLHSSWSQNEMLTTPWAVATATSASDPWEFTQIHQEFNQICQGSSCFHMFSHCSINPTRSITVYTLEGESTWMHRKYIIITYMHQPQSHKTWVEIHAQPYLHVQYSRYSHRFHEYQWNIPIWCRTGISASISRSANGLALVTVCTTTVGNVMCWSKNMCILHIYHLCKYNQYATYSSLWF